MDNRLKLTIVQADFHRNGVDGRGFYAIIFDDQDEGRMIASLFDEPGDFGYCAVYKVEELVKGNVLFGEGNSWRGDDYERALRPLLKEYFKHQG